MAQVRAFMKGDYLPEPHPTDPNQFYWLINFYCILLDGSGYYDLPTRTLVAIGDNNATVLSKIVDSVVAAVTARGGGETIPRTNVYTLQFNRGS
jgi:hypothetical protein